MGLKIWIGENFEKRHEREQIKELIATLERLYADSNIRVHLLCNFSIGGSQIDAALFKQDACILIEMKTADTPVTGNQNGTWIHQDKYSNTRISISGGSNRYRNPFQQIRNARNAVANLLERDKETFLRPHEMEMVADWRHYVQGCVLLFPDLPLTINDNIEIDDHLNPWFHCCRSSEAGELLQGINSADGHLPEKAVVKAIRDVFHLEDAIIVDGVPTSPVEDENREEESLSSFAPSKSPTRSSLFPTRPTSNPIFPTRPKCQPSPMANTAPLTDSKATTTKPLQSSSKMTLTIPITTLQAEATPNHNISGITNDASTQEGSHPSEKEVSSCKGESVIGKKEVVQSDLFADSHNVELPIISSSGLEQVDACQRQVSFAREMYEDFFKKEAIILDGHKRESCKSLGKGKWDFLVVLPFEGDEDKALKAINNAWKCPYTNPYAQQGFIVWEFPPFVDSAPVQPQEKSLYASGYFPPQVASAIEEIVGSAGRTPNRDKVSLTLGFNDQGVEWYLGTYFPRSFVETFCIFDYVFSCMPESFFAGKDTMVIVDIGIGTGGATFGLIWALRKHLYGSSSLRKIQVLGFDGNESALSVLNKISDIIEDTWPEIDLEMVSETVLLDQDHLWPQQLSYIKADFILASKFLQELADTNEKLESVYSRFFSDATTALSETGILSIVEIDGNLRRQAMESALSRCSDRQVVLLPKLNGTATPASITIGIYRETGMCTENILTVALGPDNLAASMPPFSVMPSGGDGASPSTHANQSLRAIFPQYLAGYFHGEPIQFG